MGRFRGVELADLTLTGERVELRRWQPADAQRVYEVMQDDETRAALGLPGPYSPDHARAWVTDLGVRERDEGRGMASAIVARETGRVVGACDVRDLVRNPEIGFWIAPDARGHGYAAEATRVLTDWAFGLGVPRVELHCAVGNLASARTAMVAAFRYEGVARDALLGGGMPGVPPRHGDDARFARTADDTGEPIPPAFPALAPDALSDGVLALRPARPDDAQGYREDDDPVAFGWGFGGGPRSEQDAARRMAGAGLDWLVGRTAWLSMVDVASGAFAGDLQLRLAGPPQVAEIGYTVHPGFRGRGYTSRALRLLVPWAFDVAGFARLELGAKHGNAASQRAALSAGFQPEGVRPGRLRNPDGTFADEVCFALVNPRVSEQGGPLRPA